MDPGPPQPGFRYWVMEAEDVEEEEATPTATPTPATDDFEMEGLQKRGRSKKTGVFFFKSSFPIHHLSKQTDRQIDRQTDRQSDRKTDR